MPKNKNMSMPICATRIHHFIPESNQEPAEWTAANDEPDPKLAEILKSENYKQWLLHSVINEFSIKRPHLKKRTRLIKTIHRATYQCKNPWWRNYQNCIWNCLQRLFFVLQQGCSPGGNFALMKKWSPKLNSILRL